MSVALALRDLRKTYRNGVEALRGVDLTVAEGDFFALLGPNGAGKSTTIGILTGLVTRTGGDLSVFGVDFGTRTEEAKSLMGVVPQEFNFNIFENILDIVVNQAGFYGIPRPVALERAHRYLGQLGLGDKLKGPARDLSGGMKRRLMVARALVNEPRLLILDEPTAGVDIELRRGLWDFLTELNRNGTTIILTTHYLEEAEHLCRNLAIIDHGRILEQGPIQELVRKLEVQTFVLDVHGALDEVIVPGYTVRQVDPDRLELDVREGQPLNDAFAALSAAGIQVVGLRNKSNRLEELFVRLVGRGRA